MSEKVIQIPVTYEQRKLNEHGLGYVPCLTSSQWLQFPETAVHDINIPVKLMAQEDGEDPIQLSELRLSKDDLLRAINAIKFEN